MNQLISIFLPSIFGLKQCDKVFGEAKGRNNLIERYLTCVLCVNFILYAIIIYIFKQPDFIFTNQFTIKYLALSSLLSYLLPIVWKLLNDNIKLNIRVKKHEKQN